MSRVKAVQMIEFNPQVGNKRKGYTLSGVMSFRAGNAVQGETFVPSPIVPLKDPDFKVKVGEREIGLFEFLTGRDPENADAYFVHQDRKPSMPVFRGMTADSMTDLRDAVDEQAKRLAQAGKPTPPAPIAGQRSTTETAKAPANKTVEQILEEKRNATEETDEKPEKPEKPEAPAKKVDYKELLKRVSSKSTTSRGARAELETIKDTLEADDLTYIAEHGTKLLKDWAIRVMDDKVADKDK